MDSHLLTATEVLARLQDGSLTVEQYAQSLLARIERRDSTIMAWAYLDPGYVLEQARILDKIPAEKRGPLHGVAIGVKDVIYTKRMPTQHNSPAYEGDAPEYDAGPIKILKAAGALLLGKTTTTEFAATKFGPKTRNPHGLARTPGGSSSGSAAAVSDFQAPIALGTQTGGSIIRPASFCGIYGLKPTWNSITREGVKFSALIYDTLGIFARSVEDLDLLAGVLGLADDSPPVGNFSVKGSKFAVVLTPVWAEAGPGTIAAMQRAVKLLRDNGAEVDEVTLPPEFNKMRQWYWTVLRSEGQTSFLPEYRADKEALHQTLIDQVENSTKISHAAHLEAFDNIAALRPVIDKIAKQYSAILTPSVPDVAPLGQETTGDQVFNTMWTALHVPVINIPGLKGEENMPVGVSLVAPRYHDRHLLGVAKAVGKIFEAEGGSNQ
ncbi:amidase [Thelonectria olida]|uniref:Amidase n=1 Tax=Thelonectria olida TaxID=1576542 RepID=A0A9P8W0Q4_9HYPO|nr:amidase [Thelonectria olida]